MPDKTIVPARDGWYWAMEAGSPELPCNLGVVLLERGRVWVAGREIEERPEDWRFYAGPIEPHKLD